MPESDELLTTREAAGRLGITPGRVRQLVLSGKLPAVKRGRDLFIPEAAIEGYQRPPKGRPGSK